MENQQLKTLEKAQELKQKAENKTKRHWKNAWKKAKWNRAGKYYQEAALHFCQANQDEEAKEVLIQSYNCFKRKKEWQKAAKILEQVIKIDIEREHWQDLGENAWKAAAVYDHANLPDNAAQLLEKVALVVEDQDHHLSEKLLERAVEIVEIENRPLQAAFFVSKILHMQLARDDKNEAIAKAKKLIRLYQEADHTASFERSVLTTVLLQIASNQLLDAKMTFNEHGGNCNADQQMAMDSLISGFENTEMNLVQIALENEAFSSIKIEFRKIVDDVEKKFNIGKKIIESPLPVEEEDKVDPVLELRQKFENLPKPTIFAQRKLSQRSNTLAAISVPISAYADETGYHVDQPNALGMTADQYREQRKEAMQTNDEYE